jgi:hypothetical protein
MNTNRVLGYLAAASAALAFLLWAIPYDCYEGWVCGFGYASQWFSISRGNEGLSAEAPWVFVLALAAIFLLVARAGNRR